MKSKEGEEEENTLLNLRNKKEKCTAQASSCYRLATATRPSLARLAPSGCPKHDALCAWARSSAWGYVRPHAQFTCIGTDSGKSIFMKVQKILLKNNLSSGKKEPDGMCPTQYRGVVLRKEERGEILSLLTPLETPVSLRLMSCPWTPSGSGERAKWECKSACTKRAFPQSSARYW